MKTNKGLAGVDMIIAIIVIVIFATLILTLMGNNAIENAKITKETMAIIYITEIFDKVAIADYEDIIQEKTNDLIPQDALKNYKIDIAIENNSEELEKQEDIIKKIKVTLTYNVGNKNYTTSMERYKIKE